ncbi:MAG TPA: amidohydrolase family protein [Sporichthyaceae bacterium]|nr:amidohydrolase family protein [Sporichthyaceae bacterium]
MTAAHNRAFDLVVRGATVADGTGASLRTADVAVREGRVAEVGAVTGRGHREIDATGLLVAPGWVDVHTHYDGQATWDNRLAPSSPQGVTTVVFGNCGVGFAPVRPDEHERLIALMEGVEDIPGTALHEGLPWTWESFPQYLDALAGLPHDIDVAAQVPHGPLRVHVMGDRGAAGQDATATDIVEMSALVEQALRAGALGFSTSRSSNHKSSTGEPTPSLTASADELVGIATALKRAGRGVMQLLSDFADVDAEFALVHRMAAASGRPLSFTLAEQLAFARPDDRVPYLDILERIRAARADGVRLTAQVAPRAIGLMMGLEATLHPFVANPVFAEIAGLDHGAQVIALRDPGFRARLLAAANAGSDKLGGGLVTRFDRLVELGDPPQYEPPASASIAARAAAAGVRPEELALDVMLSDDGHGLLYLPAANYLGWNFDVVREMLVHPCAVPGLSDGGAHVGTICDGGFPTFLLSYWGRDRPSGRLPVEWLIARQAGATAALVGLADRGVLAPGYRADLNVIDLELLGLRAPRVHADLPAGGRRFLQAARGYRHTFVAGVETYADGEPTGALPGRLVRGPQSVASG